MVPGAYAVWHQGIYNYHDYKLVNTRIQDLGTSHCDVVNISKYSLQHMESSILTKFSQMWIPLGVESNSMILLYSQPAPPWMVNVLPDGNELISNIDIDECEAACSMAFPGWIVLYNKTLKFWDEKIRTKWSNRHSAHVHKCNEMICFTHHVHRKSCD